MHKLLGKIILISSAFIIGGCAVTNEHYIHLDGGFNTRDLGGYKTVDGREVKWHLFYRSDDLSTLTSQGLKQAQALHLQTIVDFRTPKEGNINSSLVHPHVEAVHYLSISFGNLMHLLREDVSTGVNYEQIMMDGNRDFVHSSHAQLREFFNIVSDSANTPLLFHCTAGKDRTGFAAAMLLSALGVEREAIYQDYLLSAVYLKPKYSFLVQQNPAWAPLVTVKREYLEAAFDEIEKTYGSVDAYLTGVLGVDIEKLRALYTE